MMRVLASFGLILYIATAQAQVAEVVWVSASSVEHTILYAAYNGEEWQIADEPLYRSENALTTPVLGSWEDGSKLLLWSEQQESRVVLMSSRLSFSPVESSERVESLSSFSSSVESNAQTLGMSAGWSEAQLFSKVGAYNMAPVTVRDAANQMWVFWAADDGVSSDVYMSRQSAGRWSAEERIHAANEAPDNGPLATLDEDGNVQIIWQTFDLDTGVFDPRERTFTRALKDRSAQPIAQGAWSNIEPPAFVPDNQRVLIQQPGLMQVATVSLRKLYELYQPAEAEQ